MEGQHAIAEQQAGAWRGELFDAVRRQDRRILEQGGDD